jgi:Xaa-Pro aminopeptidase
MDKAGLWTDGRYFIQAQEQLKGVELFKMGEEGVPTYADWLAGEMAPGTTLAFDGRTFSVREFDKIKGALKEKGILFEYDGDLVGEIWKDRPPMPREPVFEHEARYAGLTAGEKLDAVRGEMGDADYYLVSALDSVAWLLNIRGRDIPQTPVAYAYALIGREEAHVFMERDKLPDDLARALTGQGFTLNPYGAVYGALKGLRGKVRFCPGTVSVGLASALPEACTPVKDETDIIAGLKAVKNETETANIRRAFIKEGVVLLRLLKFLDEWAANPEKPLYEEDISEILRGLREAQPGYIEPSFDTIAAYMANAASMHYSPVGKGERIQPKGFLLVDTGAQYLDGTTDTTRTVALGDITQEMMRDFTLVLKGNIGLATAVFPFGTTGVQLDVLARLPLWLSGQNYRSGTGHGLGYCLGVHEGPQSISTRLSGVKLKAGMLVTNEPGVYKENRYGIRTENVLLIKDLYANEDGAFMGFETVSFTPIDLRAVDADLLTPPEKAYLNAYHQQVYDTLLPHINGEEADWLKQATRPL